MNHSIFYFFHSLAHKSQVWDQIFIFFAVYLPYILIFAALVFLLKHHEVFRAESPWREFLQKKKEILTVFFASGVAWVVARTLKAMIHAPRPFVEFSDVIPLTPETGFAFPSGHATFYAALAVAIFLTHKKAGYVFMVFALIVGISRVVVGVHFPIDILGGFVLGAVIAYLVKKI